MRYLLILTCSLVCMAPVCDGVRSMTKNMTITSKAFAHGEKIPVIYSCDGQGISPPLSFSNVSPKAVSLALVMDDPDAPNQTFVHWVAWNIDPRQEGLSENIKANDEKISQGTNSAKKIGYTGPCPPTGSHRYFFKLYALDSKLSLPQGATIADFEKAIKGHVIEESKFMGTFSRTPN